MVLVMTGGGGDATVMLSTADPVPLALMALIVAENGPVTVGVPEIKPVEVFTLKPFGKPVAAKLVGLLLARI